MEMIHHKLSELRREVERAIIGQICIDWASYYVVRDYLHIGSFGGHLAQEVMRICESLHHAKLPIDLLHIQSRFTKVDRAVSLMELERCYRSVSRSALLPYHCLMLVELAFRAYLYRQSLGWEREIPTECMREFRDFQRKIVMADGHNDIFNLLDAGTQYFSNYSAPLTHRIATVARLLDTKAETIRKRHGRDMIEKTLQYYQLRKASR
jgi:replicative DNA helicase